MGLSLDKHAYRLLVFQLCDVIYLRPMSGAQKDRGATALFGIKGGVAWVAEDVFVTRSNGDLLVELWIGPRVVSILVHAESEGYMQAIYAKLAELAIDDFPRSA